MSMQSLEEASLDNKQTAQQSNDEAEPGYTEGSFINEREFSIFTQGWVPENPKGLIILQHDIAEHSTRWAPFARFLHKHGYAVFANDHESHGASEGPKEYVDDFEDLLEDTITFCAAKIKEFIDVPKIIIGGGMGATLAMHVILKHPKLFDAAILLAPPTRLTTDISPALHTVGRVASLIFPWVRPASLDIKTLCRDSKVVKAYKSDPLVWHDDPPLQFASTVLEAGLELLENAHLFDTPYLLLQGAADEMVNPLGSQELHYKTISEDKTFCMFTGFFHELLNEPEKYDIWNLILNWIDERIQSQFTTECDKKVLYKSDGNGHIIINDKSTRHIKPPANPSKAPAESLGGGSKKHKSKKIELKSLDEYTQEEEDKKKERLNALQSKESGVYISNNNAGGGSGGSGEGQQQQEESHENIEVPERQPLELTDTDLEKTNQTGSPESDHVVPLDD